MKQTRGIIMLTITALIWGTAFVAQSVGNSAGPFTFNALRNYLGFLVLLPVIFAFRHQRMKSGTYKKMDKTDWKNLILGGLCCGVSLCVASNLQQTGLMYTTVGKAGFITTLYILIVPILGLFMKKHVSGRIWIAVIMGVIGMYLLCITEDFSLAKGDAIVLGCALFYSFQILSIDHFVHKVDGVMLSCAQFAVTAVITTVLMLIFEEPTFAAIKTALPSLLYTGIMSSGVAYTFQILGQKHVQPTVATLVMSLESCFALLAGMVILNEIITGREALGCVIMFAAIILAQLPERKKQNV